MYDIGGDRSQTLQSIAVGTGRLEAVAGTGGTLSFVSNGFITDHLGNVAAVVNLSASSSTSTGAFILEQNGYHPFGTKIDLGCNLSTNRWRYTGKEEQDIAGMDLRLLDFGARFYDPYTLRWNAVDPLAHKYFDLSPYNYCGNDPVNMVDPKGDSLAVLNLGTIPGHSALLIQDSNGKWKYFSYNGDKSYKSTSGCVGGKDYHDSGSKSFDNVQAFLDSPYNVEGTKEQTEADEINNYDIQEAYVIGSTPEQDKTVQDTFIKESEKDYNVVTHECANVVKNSLNAAGLSAGKNAPILLPNHLFNRVQKNNKGGTFYEKRKNTD